MPALSHTHHLPWYRIIFRYEDATLGTGCRLAQRYRIEYISEDLADIDEHTYADWFRVNAFEWIDIDHGKVQHYNAAFSSLEVALDVIAILSKYDRDVLAKVGAEDGYYCVLDNRDEIVYTSLLA